MFVPFFHSLRRHQVPVSLREFLDFLSVLKTGIVTYDVDGFYHLARAAMVKSETHLDRFDRAFTEAFEGLASLTTSDIIEALDLPGEWLRREMEKHLTKEEMAEIEALGGFDKLMETLRDRLEEQTGRHQGGSKWIGTGGTSPFGAYGYNPEGIRIGQDRSRHRRAVKVWDKREFRDLDGDAEIGTRTIKMALRRLRRWAREGAAEELDLTGTIRDTAQNGYISVRTRPERRNGAKVLLMLDIGGSMDPHVQVMEDLFSAARAEFHHLETFYFHNCPYDRVWRNNARRWSETTPTWDVIHTYGSDWHLVIVGDAAMSPYEIAMKGGANEFWNDETGATWLQRVFGHWPRHLWINPVAEQYWDHTQSTAMIRGLLGNDAMVPMTLDGLTAGMKVLGR
ncbi:MAG: VWA domain-containing protein [Pseudomonadota bacterium]